MVMDSKRWQDSEEQQQAIEMRFLRLLAFSRSFSLAAETNRLCAITFFVVSE